MMVYKIEFYANIHKIKIFFFSLFRFKVGAGFFSAEPDPWKKMLDPHP